MVDAIEKMAYTRSGGVPWHGMGEPVSDKLTPAEMAVAAKLNWRVSKRQMFFKKADGELATMLDKFALVRDSDESLLTIVSKIYKEVQNEDALDFFKKFVKEGHMQMETAGALWHGRYIWALARVNKDFTLGKGSQADTVKSYILLCQPHAIGRAMIIQFTPIRVVCWNTLQMALGSSLKGKKHAFRMPHSIAFTDAVKQEAAEALGIAIEQMAEFKEAATLLAKKRATEQQSHEYFREVLKIDAKAAAAAKEDEEPVKDSRLLTKFKRALTYAPGQDLNTSKGTWWGSLNAVSYVIDHEIGNDRDTALATAWFGTRALTKRRALVLALEKAEKAKAA
jgi:phage/plasmid-like protein (TIGR03299 family)